MRGFARAFAFFTLTLIGSTFLSPGTANATGIANLVVGSCVASGGNLSISFNPLINQWQTGSYAIAISSACAPNAASIWYSSSMNGACPGSGFPTGGGGGGNPQYLTVSTSIAVTLTSGTFNVIVIVTSNTWIGNCTGDISTCVSGITIGCGSPTNTPTISPTNTVTPTTSPTRTISPSPTITQTISPSPTFSISPTTTPSITVTNTFTYSPTRTNTALASPTNTVSPTITASPTITNTTVPTPSSTVTPAFQLTKTANVATANLGDTITYTINWKNYDSASQTIVVWDTVAAQLSYLGAAPAPTSYLGGVLTWNLGAQAPGASGTITFWAVVTGYPWWPDLKSRMAAIEEKLRLLAREHGLSEGRS